MRALKFDNYKKAGTQTIYNQNYLYIQTNERFQSSYRCNLESTRKLSHGRSEKDAFALIFYKGIHVDEGSGILLRELRIRRTLNIVTKTAIIRSNITNASFLRRFLN